VGSRQITLQFDLAETSMPLRRMQTAIAAAVRRAPGMPNQPTLKKVNPADQPITTCGSARRRCAFAGE